jgi:steroid delta-isomerase-like uncharacterized protein
MTAKDAAKWMEEALEAVAAKDLEALRACWHDELVENFVVLGPVEGKEAAASFFTEMFAAMPDMQFTIDRVMGVDDTTAVGQWHLEGTFSGGPFQGLQPTGRTIDLRGIDVMEFDDGLLRHNTVYYDGLAFARQVGLLPPAGSRGDRGLMSVFNAFTRTKARFRRK